LKYLNHYCVKAQFPQPDSNFLQCMYVGYFDYASSFDMCQHCTLFSLYLIVTAYVDKRFDYMIKAVDTVIYQKKRSFILFTSPVVLWLWCSLSHPAIYLAVPVPLQRVSPVYQHRLPPWQRCTHYVSAVRHNRLRFQM